MLDGMATRVPRGPVRDVDGVLVRALRHDLGLSLMDFGSALGKEKATVYRWELGGIDELTWRGLLSMFGLPSDWQPSAEVQARADAEVSELRAAASARKPK